MNIALQHIGDESELIAACIRREKWAQKIIYETYYTEMLYICMRYAKDELQAEDILHESFIKVFRSIHKYKPNTALNAWIKRIVVNSAIDQYRKNARNRHADISETSHMIAPNIDAHSRCSEQEILLCVQALSDRYRTVFNMYVMEGYSHGDIAQKLQISESTSRSNLAKARAKLRDLLTDKGIKYEK